MDAALATQLRAQREADLGEIEQLARQARAAEAALDAKERDCDARGHALAECRGALVRRETELAALEMAAAGRGDGGEGAAGGSEKKTKKRKTFRIPGSLLQSVKRPPQQVTLTLEALMRQAYSLWQQKMLADVADDESGRQRESFPRYVKCLFLAEHGSRAEAMGSLGEWVAAVEHHAREGSRRAEMLAILCGLRRAENYSRHIADCFFLFLRRMCIPDRRGTEGGSDSEQHTDDAALLSDVREMFEDGEGSYVIPVSGVVEALVGRESEGVDQSEPATWTIPALEPLLSAEEVLGLVSDSRRLPVRRGRNIHDVKGALTTGVDIDAILWLTLERLLVAMSAHAAKLGRAFQQFSNDNDNDNGNGNDNAESREGLSYRSFLDLVDFCAGSGEKGRMGARDKAKLFESIEERGRGGGDGEREESEADISDPRVFVEGVLRSTCRLSTPQNCRAYWTRAS